MVVDLVEPYVEWLPKATQEVFDQRDIFLCVYQQPIVACTVANL